ncbi:DUF2793 domain-containing protein [Litoreibacter sp.]|nr:DUF2793 domain-containing protein [Litoreibacter sp.]
MSETAKLRLPLIASAQAQKHITVNEALARIDATAQLSVESRMLNAPPFVVSEGECYLIGPGATDTWVGQDGKMATYLNGGWVFIDPLFGWQVWVDDEAVRLTFDGVTWIENMLAVSVNRAALRAEVVETDFVLSGGGATEDTGFVIPAHTSVLAVTGRVLSEITGDLVDWSLGVDGMETRYGSGLGISVGSWLRGVTGQPVAYYTPTGLRLTANGGNFAGGTVRLAVHLMQFDVPTAD